VDAESGKVNVYRPTPEKYDRNVLSGGGWAYRHQRRCGRRNSQAFKVTFRHVYDGIPQPTTGSPDFDQTAYTRIGNTINVVRFRQGKAVEVAQIVIVPGSTTNNAEGIAANDQPNHSVLVFDRQ
jgi:hypothetical protein